MAIVQKSSLSGLATNTLNVKKQQIATAMGSMETITPIKTLPGILSGTMKTVVSVKCRPRNREHFNDVYMMTLIANK